MDYITISRYVLVSRFKLELFVLNPIFMSLVSLFSEFIELESVITDFNVFILFSNYE